MALLSRLERLEQRAQPDPYAHLSDSDLETTIALLRANIESASGMSEPALAADFSQRLVDGTLPPDLDPIAVSKFIQLILSEVNGKTRSV
ncbi:hypothetical protein [Aminobacter sp. LjRoot7]|uniref:hypothetical protein n=1 Tax=Aminobacter sp. LjRoot7 TaxID=3342335 RepID=UPI003ECC8B97